MKLNVENMYYHDGQFYTFAAELEYSIDNNYGADADGKRGEKRYFLDEVNSLAVYNNLGESVEDNVLLRLITISLGVNLEDYV